MGWADGVVGYLGALFVFGTCYFDIGTLSIPRPPSIIFGIVLFVVGVYIHFKAQLDYNRYGQERGLIDKGIYGVFKHPMYVGWSVVVIGAVLASRSYLGLATSWLWILLIAICGALEEARLKKTLPQGEYQKYARGKLF